MFFPARAGVILAVIRLSMIVGGFPRTRGGDPSTFLPWPAGTLFSPHARG